MDIKVPVTGYVNCESTVAPIEQVAHAKGVPVSLQKEEALRDIMGHSTMATPGEVVHGKVVHAGGMPNREWIGQWHVA